MTLNSERFLRDAVAGLLGDDGTPVSDAENLFEAGMDSIGLLRLVNQCRRAGLQVNFADLARDPTLAAWMALIDPERRGGPVATRSEVVPPHGAPAAGRSGSLGAMQHAYWVGRNPGQRLGGVAAHLYAEFDRSATDGPPAIDPDRLRVALERLVERHETLRTRITADGQQNAVPTLPAPLAIYDLTERSGDDVQAHLARMREAFSHQMLDIEDGRVFAVALSLLPRGATRLHIDVDMIAADAVSYRILLADLAELYASPADRLRPLTLTYRDYLGLTASEKDAGARSGAAAWASRIDELPGPPVLPERMQAGRPRVARRHTWLPPERKATLGETARRNGVTVAMVAATVLSEVVGHWSATDHFLLNVPMFDRLESHPEVDRVVGDFSSSIMLEVDLRAPLAFGERVRSLQRRMHADAAHAGYTGLDVLRELGRQRGETVLAPVVFTSALGLGELFAPAVTEVVGRPVWVISQGPQVLLDAQLTEFEGGLLVNWDTREEAFPPGVVDAMFHLFEDALGRVIDAPEIWGRPLALAGRDTRRPTHGGRPARILDRSGMDRPAHVPGRLQIGEGDQPGPTVWARSDLEGGVTVLGSDADKAMIHGVAVWPLEVEEAVRSDDRVRDVVVVRTDRGFAAAVAPHPPAGDRGVLTGKGLRAELARRVPGRLLPARVLILDELPRDAAGRLDPEAARRLLESQPEETDRLAPRTDLERVIADVWGEMLGLGDVGVNEEFIALGGDSLLAARVVARLQEELDTGAVTLRALFRSPTVAELAEQLRRDDPGRLDEVAAIVLEIRAMSDEEVAAKLGETVERRGEVVS